jgi:hypothetical protein
MLQGIINIISNYRMVIQLQTNDTQSKIFSKMGNPKKTGSKIAEKGIEVLREEEALSKILIICSRIAS